MQPEDIKKEDKPVSLLLEDEGSTITKKEDKPVSLLLEDGGTTITKDKPVSLLLEDEGSTITKKEDKPVSLLEGVSIPKKDDISLILEEDEEDPKENAPLLKEDNKKSGESKLPEAKDNFQALMNRRTKNFSNPMHESSESVLLYKQKKVDDELPLVAYFIALDKLRKMLVYTNLIKPKLKTNPKPNSKPNTKPKQDPATIKISPIIEENENEENKKEELSSEDILKSENELRDSISCLHKEIFTASGYFAWLKRNFKRDGQEELEKFNHDKREDSTERKFRDLLLREIIWVTAEQIRHCPQRLNHLFFMFSGKNETWYAEPFRLTTWLLYNKTTRIEDVKEELKFPSLPLLEMDAIRKGIKEFQNGELNFDDIDDCGKWMEEELTKTFVEPPGAAVFFFLLKYLSGTIQFKVWLLALVYFLYKFQSPIPDETHMIGGKYYKFSAILGFILLDFGIMTTLIINDWMIRILCVRHNRFSNMDAWHKIRTIIPVLQPILGAAGIVAYLFVAKAADWKDAVIGFRYFYIGGRLLFSIAPEFLPYSPTIVLKEKKFWKGLRKRYIARVSFVLLVGGLGMLYEWGFLMSTFDTLFETVYCGSDTFDYQITNLNVQEIICFSSTILLWFVTIIAVLIDNGLCFITAMAFVGWIRGYKTQGSARALVQLDLNDLYKKIALRFIKNSRNTFTPDNSILPTGNTAEVSAINSVSGSIDVASKIVGEVSDGKKSKKGSIKARSNKGFSQRDFLTPDMKKLEEKHTAAAKAIWGWCLEYWRSEDLISDKEKEYLQNGPTIDCSLIGSADAQKHISFWLNTLNVAPVHNFSFKEIPSTSIMIPVYSEKLIFDWNPAANYNPQSEFHHLIGKYPEEWLNLLERVQKDVNHEKIDILETYLSNQTDLSKENPKVMDAVTDWLSMHDQYVEKTVKGSCHYYYALVQLGVHEGGLTLEEAKFQAKQKLQVILCVQIYQKRHKEISAILARWMKEFPCLQIVIDYEKTPNQPPEFDNIRPEYDYATCLLEWDDLKNKVVYRHVLPRKNPLRICDVDKRYIQGKSQNQVNGMTFAFGRFTQVLDANQGGHATEYLKFPSLLKDFQLDPKTGKIRYRIIGAREYIFTKNLGTVARCHAYQEWSFGTLVLRTYSDLGIRLHYGHPDVFHGPWALAHSGLSKVNPDINTSEDVFAGFETMKCHENTKHLEHIQFQKGRETGLANMSMFDTKISQGNSGILRSRDMYHLMERNDFVTSFLFFQGVSGHFTTISLMMWSMRLYIITLFMMSLSGSSLKAWGSISYATEWLFHAGLTTVVPLIVEFLVEYGPVMGLLRSLFFLPISTMIYLFQMQTKHAAFIRGVFTGRATHINTGRGLAIYRASLIDLFKNYGNTHYFPIMYIVAITVVYKLLSTELGGGTLPLIMIYVLCAAVIISPVIFNPALTGNSLKEAGEDLMNFMVWIGKTEDNMYYSEWPKIEQLKGQSSFLNYWILIDYENLPENNKLSAVRGLIYQFACVLFWSGISIFLLYPHIQFWLIFYLFFWCVSSVTYFAIYYLLKTYEQPLRIIVVFLGTFGAMLYYLITYGTYGTLTFTELYTAFLIAAKLLESVRAFVCCILTLKSIVKFNPTEAAKEEYAENEKKKKFEEIEKLIIEEKKKPENQSKTDDDIRKKLVTQLIPGDITEKLKEKFENERESERQRFVTFHLSVINKIFFAMAGRMLMALAWALINFIVALLLRPIIANYFLFGMSGNHKGYDFLRRLRKIRAKQNKFGVKV